MQKASWTISGSPIRLLLDNDVNVTVCGFRRTKTVSEEIFDVIQQCNLDPSETLNLVFNGFRSNFQSHKIRQEMSQYARYRSERERDWENRNEFGTDGILREETVRILKESGFVHFGRRKWIVKDGAFMRRRSIQEF